MHDVLKAVVMYTGSEQASSILTLCTFHSARSHTYIHLDVMTCRKPTAWATGILAFLHLWGEDAETMEEGC